MRSNLRAGICNAMSLSPDMTERSCLRYAVTACRVPLHEGSAMESLQSGGAAFCLRHSIAFCIHLHMQASRRVWCAAEHH
jgi:hypothetical protein